jgi:hypothetical protein
MRHRRLGLAIAVGLFLAAAVAGWAQDASTDTAGTKPDAGMVDTSVSAERNERWSELSDSLEAVSEAFGHIRTYARTGFVVPVATVRAMHVEMIIALLERSESAADSSTSGGQVTVDVDPGYLLGEGGRLGRLTAALDAYVSFLEPYSSVLVGYYDAKCPEYFAPDVCPMCSPDSATQACQEGWGQGMLDNQLDLLSRLAERVTALAQLTLEAALRIDLHSRPDGVTPGFLSIYAYAVTAVGYWPIQSGGNLPSPDTVPSMLLDFRIISEGLDRDLAAALDGAPRGS